MDSPHRCSCSDHPPDVLDNAATSRRTSRLQHWISEQCHLAVTDLGLELEPLFSAATYIPVARRPQAPDVGVNHRKTVSADSSNSTSSSSSSPSKKHAPTSSSDALVARDKDGWYWRTSTSSSSSEGDSILASYILPSNPAPPPTTNITTPAEDGGDLDARSDSPLLGFASDSEDEQELPQQLLEVHRSSRSSDDFPQTPGPEDMDTAFLVLTRPVTPNPQPEKEKERKTSPKRDKLRYPGKGYRRELPSGLEDHNVNIRHDVQEQQPPQTQSQTKRSSRYRCSLHAEHTREDQVTTPTPHYTSYAQNPHQRLPSSSSSPSFVQSSPSLFPASSLSSYPSMTSLSSLHSRPSVASLHSLSSELPPQLRPALSRKPSLARKPSFPLLKEVKEEEGESVVSLRNLDDEEGTQRERSMNGDEVMSQSSTDETVLAQGPLLPSAPIMSTTAIRSTINSRMRAHSASTVPAAPAIGLGVPSGHSYSHSFSYASLASVPSPVLPAHIPVPSSNLVPPPMRASIGLGLGPGVGVRTQTRSRSNSAVNDIVPTNSLPIGPSPTRASIGMGLGPGVGVRTQTRSRSNSSSTGASNVNSKHSVYSTYSIAGMPATPGSAAVFLDARTPPGTATSAMSVSVSGTPGNGAGARHAVYIVDSEEVRRRLGELLLNEGGDDDDDDMDEESRRRTVMMLDEGEREMADPVLPLRDYFPTSRGLVYEERVPEVIEPEHLEQIDETEAMQEFRPSTPPPPALGYRNSAVITTPTRRVPYPNNNNSNNHSYSRGHAHTPSPSFASTVNVPPPNTPSSGGGYGCVYASPYASSSQIYLGPGSGSGGSGNHSRESSRESRDGDSVQVSVSVSVSSAEEEEEEEGAEGSLLLPSAPILTKADLEKRLGPPPKRPPPAPPLDLGLELGGVRMGELDGFRFPSPAPSKRALFEEEEIVHEPEFQDEEEVAEDAYGGMESVDEIEMEALRREMGLELGLPLEDEDELQGREYPDDMGVRMNFERGSLDEEGGDETIKARGKGRPSLSLVVPSSSPEKSRRRFDDGGEIGVGVGKQGMQSRWSIASSVLPKDLDEPVQTKNGRHVGPSEEDMDVEAMGMMGVSVGGLIGIGSGIGTKRWRRRSKENAPKDGKNAANASKAKSAPSSPISRNQKEKRKSFPRGEGEGHSPQQQQQPHQQGGKRSRLASFFSKLAGSGSTAGTPTSASTGASSPIPPSRVSSNSTSEPDLRVVSGAWESMPLEAVPPVPPMPPLHTLPRLASKSSMLSLKATAAASSNASVSASRRGTMMSQVMWDDDDYYGSVPPTPSSLATGFSAANVNAVAANSASTSPRGSVAGGLSLRTSRSVSNLNLNLRGERVVSPSFGFGTGVMSASPAEGMEVLGGVEEGGDVGRERVLLHSSLPPPPVPPKDFVAGAPGYEWPSVSHTQILPSSSNMNASTSVQSATAPLSPVVPMPVPMVKGVEETVRERMMVRLRLKSSPSLGNLRERMQQAAQQQHGHGQGKFRSLAARMMGRESGEA